MPPLSLHKAYYQVAAAFQRSFRSGHSTFSLISWHLGARYVSTRWRMSPRSNHTQTSYLYISGNIDWYLNGVNTSYNNPLLRAVLMFRVIYCHLWAEYGPQQWWCVTCPLAGSSSLLDIREPPGCWNLWAFIARGWLNSKPPYDHTRTNFRYNFAFFCTGLMILHSENMGHMTHIFREQNHL